MPCIDILLEKELNNILQNNNNKIIIINFWAEWCKPCEQLNQLFKQFSDTFQNSIFINIEAEKSEISQQFEINSVPTFLFLKNQKVIDKIEGANSSELTQKISKYNSEIEKSNIDLNKRLETLINSSYVMLFMKGTPDNIKCGFSAKMVEILKKENIQFGYFNILMDEEVRQGLKVYSNWPTYPQLYINGKLIGGLDIVKELYEEGELSKMLKQENK